MSNPTAIMELFITFFLLIVFLQHVDGEYGIDHPLFVVWGTENKIWCLTANSDATEVSLQLCDFEGAPANQIWYRTDDENFLTSLVPFDGWANENNSCLSHVRQ